MAMNHEKLEIWKRSCRLSVNIFKTLAEHRDYGFKDQITRSSLSIPSNIAEGMERESIKERYRFLVIAKGSAGELKTQAYIGAKAGIIPENTGLAWAKEAGEIAAMIGAFSRTLFNN